MDTYENKYKEALEIAMVAYKDEDRHLKATLERIFPELTESEDEKIRKKIIDYFRGSVGLGVAIGGVSVKDMVSWLEKQGEKKAKWTDNDRTMAFTLMRDVDQMSYISKEGKDERIGWLNSLDEKFASTESAWNEEDSFRMKTLISVIKSGGNIRPELRNEFVNWLKSIKERIIK